MTNSIPPPEPRPPSHDADAVGQDAFQRQVEEKARRKIKARREKGRSPLFWLGTFGLVGWSVAIPALVGIAVGIWVDRHWPSPYSWTLMGLLLGMVTGCLNAWYWIQKERRE